MVFYPTVYMFICLFFPWLSSATLFAGALDRSSPGCFMGYLCDTRCHMPMWTQNDEECLSAATPTQVWQATGCLGLPVFQESWILQETGALVNSVLVEHSFHSCSAAWLHQTVIAPCSVCGEPRIPGGFTTHKSEGSQPCDVAQGLTGQVQLSPSIPGQRLAVLFPWTLSRAPCTVTTLCVSFRHEDPFVLYILSN